MVYEDYTDLCEQSQQTNVLYEKYYSSISTAYISKICVSHTDEVVVLGALMLCLYSCFISMKYLFLIFKSLKSQFLISKH